MRTIVEVRIRLQIDRKWEWLGHFDTVPLAGEIYAAIDCTPASDDVWKEGAKNAKQMLDHAKPSLWPEMRNLTSHHCVFEFAGMTVGEADFRAIEVYELVRA